MGAMDAHLDRMRAHPEIAGRVLRLEYTSVSLNPQAKLFGRRSLLEQFDPATARTGPSSPPLRRSSPTRGRCTRLTATHQERHIDYAKQR